MNDTLIKTFNGYDFFKKSPGRTFYGAPYTIYVKGKSGAYKQLSYSIPAGWNRDEIEAYENEVVKTLLSHIEKADRFDS